MRLLHQLPLHALLLAVLLHLSLYTVRGEEEELVFLPSDVIAFYYPWYGGDTESYMHWRHRILPHWKEDVRKRYPTGVYVPPDDIGAASFPLRGLYSSLDVGVVSDQMRELRQAGVGVVCTSWWGRPGRDNCVDGEGIPTDNTVPTLLDAAALHGLRVSFHLEPYVNRTIEDVRGDIHYLVERYGSHPAFYRSTDGSLPLLFAYDSYHFSATEWARILSDDGPLTIRNTPDDATVISLVLKHGDLNFVRDSKFDGLYTYFSAEGFTYGSTRANWGMLSRWAHANRMLFIPSVGPGYDDTRIRPWNAQHKRDRSGGEYYDSSWRTAIASSPDAIGITSYNEWGEGTQIEPAASGVHIADGANGAYTYESYPASEEGGESDPHYFMKRTAEWVRRFRDRA